MPTLPAWRRRWTARSTTTGCTRECGTSTSATNRSTSRRSTSCGPQRSPSASDVWEALAQIPDPEIPTVSVVDLGVIRDVDVRDGTARVEFTPTFLGCPALEVMRDAIADKVRALGAEPDVRVILDDSWSTDRITAAGREKLRSSGFA